ncbi:MAG: DUF3016 domain-containing protein [Leptothrix sp. (in: Bacteria)]|nr:DUF3016 domain-containing protein [Leptothrix sp. (in: b-proteobacteria)]
MLVLAAAITLPTAAAEVEVSFIGPDKFTDIGRNHGDRDSAMKTLADQLQALGRTLPAGQTLHVEVTDVDLAGEIRPFIWHFANEIRVLRGQADWPRVALRYTLQAEGRTLKAGEAQVSDMNYLGAQLGPDLRGEPLRYENRMLRRWFNETFAAR